VATTIEVKSRWARWILSAIFGLVLLTAPASSFGGVFISVGIAPPALPVYTQPLCPGPGFIWTPGHWAYGPAGYYWVPGVWVDAPFVGALWTPGYWGWSAGLYLWHPGYWGHHVGFYGGINYGFGYFGVGYSGGYWHNGVFAYNRSVSHVDVTRIHNTYTRSVSNNMTARRVSYNGGAGGTHAQPTAAERAAEHEQHTAATARQTQHNHAASTSHAQSASVNHGGRAGAATAHRAPSAAHGVASSSHGAAIHSMARNTRSAGPSHANTRPQTASHASHAAAAPRSGGHPQSASHASGAAHAARGRRS
jgi:hypothetical protein